MINLIHRAFYIFSSKTIFYKELTYTNIFPNKLVDQQIKLYHHNIQKNNNTTYNNHTNRINRYYGNEMHYNYKLDEQAITNIIKRYMKRIEKEKQIKLIIYNTKFKTLNFIV